MRNITESKLNALLRSAAPPNGDLPIYDALIRYRFATLAEMNHYMRNHQVELSFAAENTVLRPTLLRTFRPKEEGNKATKPLTAWTQ